MYVCIHSVLIVYVFMYHMHSVCIVNCIYCVCLYSVCIYIIYALYSVYYMKIGIVECLYGIYSVCTVSLCFIYLYRHHYSYGGYILVLALYQ